MDFFSKYWVFLMFSAFESWVFWPHRITGLFRFGKCVQRALRVSFLSFRHLCDFFGSNKYVETFFQRKLVFSDVLSSEKKALTFESRGYLLAGVFGTITFEKFRNNCS